MDSLKEFDIEFVKLKEGSHEYDYVLDNKFFESQKSSLSSKGVNVKLEFVKSINMFYLNFDFDGLVETECDRCLSDLSLPIKGKQSLIVKVTDKAMDDEDNIVYIGEADYKINVAQYLYEYLHLMLPIKKTCDLVEKECDTAVTSKITMLFDFDSQETIDPERDTDLETEQE